MFHPGHHELHGVTVVVETAGPLTYVGRFDTEDAAGVHLLDVGVHDAAAGGTREDFVRRSARFGVLAPGDRLPNEGAMAARFGVRSDRKHLVVPLAEVARITPLGAMES